MKILFILLCCLCVACEQDVAAPSPDVRVEVASPAVTAQETETSRRTVESIDHRTVVVAGTVAPVQTISAHALGLQILSDTGNSAEPLMPAWVQGSNENLQQEDYSVDGLQVIVHRKLFLADPESPQVERRKEYFFVWPEEALGSRITQGRYSHRTRTIQDTWIGTLNPHPIWHDVENHRWFVPLAEIFRSLPEYGPMDVKMDHSQVLTLELNLENGNTIIIEIVFQAVGPFPRFQFISVPRVDPVYGQDFVTLLAREGWVIHEEILHNPSTRAFHLWLKPHRATQDLQFSTHLKSSTYTNQRESPPAGPFWHYYISTGDVAVSEVEMISPIRPLERQRVSANSWLQVILRPGEVLNLKWKVKPLLTTQRCLVPLGVTQTYHWSVMYPLQPLRTLFPLAVQPLSIPHSISHLKAWAIAGGKLRGEWGREVRLTHDFVTREEATQAWSDSTADRLSPFLSLTADATVNEISPVQVHAGEVVGTRLRFNCQGVFP